MKGKMITKIIIFELKLVILGCKTTEKLIKPNFGVGDW